VELFQLGFVVRDLESAQARYEGMLGVESWKVYTYDGRWVRERSYRGQPEDYAMRLALSNGTPQIELIQPLSGRSIYNEWLEAERSGIHHIGYRVASIDDAVESMTSAGFELLQSGRGYGLDGDGGFAYFDTEEQVGVILEAIEVPRRRRPSEA
jgi:methylmalonyl-CoA/ethylmalonyl-CoA epimerase